MAPEALTVLYELGPIGVILCALAWYVVRREARHEDVVERLRAELRAINEARVTQAQDVAEKLLELTERWHTVLVEQRAMLRDLIDSLESRTGGTDVRRRRDS